MKQVGIIGLGNMGLPMAKNLLGKGYRVYAYDINRSQVEIAVQEGAVAADSARQLCSLSEVIVLSLPNIPVLQDVVSGTDGLIRDDLTGKTIIDTTTATMRMAQRLAEDVAARGGAFLDSPVTGGTMGAEKGTLNIMVGGDYAAFQRHLDVYQAIGGKIVYIGPSGHGQVSKLVNQLLMGAIYVSVSESFAFASQLGVDIAKVYEAIEFGGAKSGLLSGMKAHILSGEYGGQHYLGQHGKDIDYAMEEANLHHSYMPVASAVHEVWNLARLQGLSHLNSPSLFAVWENILGKKLNSTVGARNSNDEGQ